MVRHLVNSDDRESLYSTPARATRDGAPDARSICRFVDSTVGRASHDTEIIEAHNVSDRPQLALFFGADDRGLAFRSRRCDLTCANSSSMRGQTWTIEWEREGILQDCSRHRLLGQWV